MIYIDYYFKSSATPKYLDPVAEMIEAVYKHIFVDEESYKAFVSLLTKKLKAIPKASGKAHVDSGPGWLHVVLSRQVPEPVLRISCKPVCGFLQFFTNSKTLERIKNITFKDNEKGGAL
ncbi:MAG: hypothetical protein ACFNM6_00085 [Prevotella sp.]